MIHSTDSNIRNGIVLLGGQTALIAPLLLLLAYEWRFRFSASTTAESGKQNNLHGQTGT